jgi:hypothetical protein
VYALIGTGYTSLEECVDGCGACIQGSGTPTSVEFETFTIPDALQVFDKCNDPSLSNAIIDTGPLSTQGTPYVAGDLDICPECLAICVTASGVGTAWWFKAYDALGGLVFSEAGGYEGNTPACFGQSCNTSPYSLNYITSGICTANGNTGYFIHENYGASSTWQNGIDPAKFAWISPYSASDFAGSTLYTANFSESADISDSCIGEVCLRYRYINIPLVCSGNILWSLLDVAVSGLANNSNGEPFTYGQAWESCIEDGANFSYDCDASCIPPLYFNINPTYPTFPS